MYNRTIDDVDIKGLMVSIYDFRKKSPELTGRYKNVQRKLKKRKLVSPEWIELFYKCQTGSDGMEALWHSLSPSDKDFFSYVVHNFLKGDAEFQKKIQPTQGSNIIYIIANSYKDVYTRIKLLEDGVKAGVNNENIWNEYKELIQRLVDSGQIPKHVAVKILRQHGL